MGATRAAINSMATVVALATLAAPGGVRAADSVAAEAFRLRMDGQAKAAERVLLAAVAKDPANASVQFELARTRFYLVAMDRAQTAIEKAVRHQPDNARYHRWAGVIAEYNAILKHKNPKTRPEVAVQMKKAFAAFQKAVALRPDYHEARFDLINCLAKNPASCGGSPAKAKAQAQALAAADAVYGVRAQCLLLARSKRDEKRRLWEAVVAKHPDRADAHEGLARVCMGTAKGDREIDRTLELDPGRGELLVDLARHYAMAKQYAQAEKAIERYLKLKPAPAVPMRPTPRSAPPRSEDTGAQRPGQRPAGRGQEAGPPLLDVLPPAAGLSVRRAVRPAALRQATGRREALRSCDQCTGRWPGPSSALSGRCKRWAGPPGPANRPPGACGPAIQPGRCRGVRTRRRTACRPAAPTMRTLTLATSPRATLRRSSSSCTAGGLPGSKA